MQENNSAKWNSADGAVFLEKVAQTDCTDYLQIMVQNHVLGMFGDGVKRLSGTGFLILLFHQNAVW